jgi:hypothetical protein
LEGANLIPGQPIDQSAYRSELGGVYGIMLTCQLLCKVYHVTQGSIEVACDGLSAGQESLVYDSPPNPSRDHFDMIEAIRTMKKQLPLCTHY